MHFTFNIRSWRPVNYRLGLLTAVWL